MQFYIRHRDSGLYFRQTDHWVSTIGEGKAFNSRDDAMDFSGRLLLTHVEVVSPAETAVQDKRRDSLAYMRFANAGRPKAHFRNI
jgi:hypothetical protein